MTELQLETWDKMQKISIRGKSNELITLQDYSQTICFQSSKGSKWIFRLFKTKANNTSFHAFLLPSEHSLPDISGPVDTATAERLDFNIVINESLKNLGNSVSLSIRSFVVYKKICAVEFIEMLFKQFPKVQTILYPSSHKGLETAIKKSIFSLSTNAKMYLIYRTDYSP
jgi:hypothetical protein